MVFPFDAASDQINQGLSGRIFPIGKYKVQVKKAEVYGSGRTTVLHLWTGGAVNAEFYLIGKPQFDPLTNVFSVPDLDFDVKSQKALQAVAWLLHSSIRQFLIQKVTVSLATRVQNAKANLESEINKQVNQHVGLQGKIAAVRCLGIVSSTTKWQVLLSLDGSLTANVQ